MEQAEMIGNGIIIAIVVVYLVIVWILAVKENAGELKDRKSYCE
jgi:hypothetical protein